MLKDDVAGILSREFYANNPDVAPWLSVALDGATVEQRADAAFVVELLSAAEDLSE